MPSSLTDAENRILLAFCVIGLLTLSKLCVKLLKWLWSMFLRSPKMLTSYGSWALITGCTDGIGKALTFEFASKGLNLVLVSRNVQKLQDLSYEIWDKYGKENVNIKIIVIDFANVSGVEIEGKIREEIEGLDVGVLVNNVGIASEILRFFDEIDFETIDSSVDVNIGSTTWVTRAVLPGMLQKRKGAIVNIGSACTVVVPSIPLYALYAATKAYVSMLSRSLGVEYKSYGIDVQCQAPLFIATKMVPTTIPSIVVPSPEQYSKAGAKWIGYEFLCNPLKTHAVQGFLLSVVPEALMNWIVLKYVLYLRSRMLQNKRTS